MLNLGCQKEHLEYAWEKWLCYNKWKLVLSYKMINCWIDIHLNSYKKKTYIFSQDVSKKLFIIEWKVVGAL